MLTNITDTHVPTQGHTTTTLTNDVDRLDRGSTVFNRRRGNWPEAQPKQEETEGGV